MTATVVETTDNNDTVPEGAVPIRMPIMVVEGMETADGRYIEPGTLTVRDLPIPIFAKTRNTHGSDGDTATLFAGSITAMKRLPGPEAEGYNGAKLPEGTFAWEGTGWLYTDVPAAPEKSAYQLVRDGALRGNSVDMSEVVAEYQGADGELADEHSYFRIVMQSGVIAGTTLVAMPAFPSAYIALDGQAMEPPPAEQLTASITHPWVSAELGDECSPCLAGVDVVTAAMPAGDDFDPPERDYSTSGMVALIPTNPNMLLVPGGDPAGELHLTLAYLGDRVDEWTPEQVEAVHVVARKLTDRKFAEQLRRDEAAAAGVDIDEYGTPYISDAMRGPLAGNIFAHAVFNPNGGEFEPASVYLLDGSGDRSDIEFLASNVQGDVTREVGDVLIPRQHSPYIPHVTAGYDLPVDQLTYTGPVEFDRIRVAIGDQVVDYPLGGGEPALVASISTLPPVEWFQDPQLTEPTALTVTDDGRVYGHIAAWNSCHTGFADRCVPPPRSAADYAYFMVHATRARGADGQPVNVAVGYGTLSPSAEQGGHAGLTLTARQAAAHYDNNCTAAFELAVGEDEHGIWCAGRLMPGLDEFTEHRARGTAFSGDWRNIRGNLELMAALAVNTPGYVIPRARVASGAPMALTAAGAVVAPKAEPADGPFPNVDVLAVNQEEFRSVVAWVNAQRLSAEVQQAVAELGQLLADTPSVEELAFAAEAELTLTVDGDHPWFDPDAVFAEELDPAQGEAEGSFTAAGRKVLHLPPYIKRISKHLEKGGMSKSHAIASAVNAAKKMCSTGDLNLPGVQQVNAGSKAQACAAVAQWKKDRPGAK